jgi:hypothetical protein
MTTTHPDLENSLVRQKDQILELINDTDLEEAKKLLDFVAELWGACDYEYKRRELYQRLAGEFRKLIRINENLLVATEKRKRGQRKLIVRELEKLRKHFVECQHAWYYRAEESK